MHDQTNLMDIFYIKERETPVETPQSALNAQTKCSQRITPGRSEAAPCRVKRQTLTHG